MRSAEEIGLWRDADVLLRLSILERVAVRRIAGLGRAASVPIVSAD